MQMAGQGTATLAGQVALVTGASRGIGKAIALRLARDGADIVVHYHNKLDEAQAVAEAIAALGRRTHLERADLSEPGTASRLVEAAAAHFGRLDILVNNAGLELRAPFWDVTEADYDQVVTVNLKSVFFATQAMVRHLRAQSRPGRIINISSVHEDLAFPNFAPYCVAKGGLRMLTRNVAVELAGTQITINNIAPGAIETDINGPLLADANKRAALLAQIPARRLGHAQEVAALAAFLASPEASYITGATYGIDGGLTVHYEEQ